MADPARPPNDAERPSDMREAPSFVVRFGAMLAVMRASPPNDQSEREINLLVDMQIDNPADSDDKKHEKLKAREAYRAWKEGLQWVEERLERRENRICELKGEIYQFIGLYGVVVGLVFIAVQSDRVQCQHVWCPFVICFAACLATIEAIDMKVTDIQRVRIDINYDGLCREKLLPTLSGIIRPLGHDFDLSRHTREAHILSKFRHHANHTDPSFLTYSLVFLTFALSGFYIIQILCYTKSPSCDPDVLPPGMITHLMR